MREYALEPKDCHKSFYGKAVVTVTDEDEEILKSYNTKVLRKDEDGTFHRLGENKTATATTLRHIKAFSGLNKKQYLALPYEG